MTDRESANHTDPQELAYKRWMRYSAVIGGLPWKWVADENQDSIPEERRKGALQCVVPENYLAECTRREALRTNGPGPDEERAEILRRIAEDNARRGIAPAPKPMRKSDAPFTLPVMLEVVGELAGTEVTPLTSTASGDTTISIAFDSRKQAQTEFASNLGLDLDAPPPKVKPAKEKEKAGRPAALFKYNQPSTLDDAVFYRSAHEGNRVFGFIPQPHKPGAIKQLLKQSDIAANGNIHTTLGSTRGTRITIDERGIEALNRLVKVWPDMRSAQSALPVQSATSAASAASQIGG